MTITKELVSKIDSLLDKGLVCGLGSPIPGRMCVEAMICYALGLPHNDDPQCVSPAIRRLKISLNDATNWPSKHARAKGMRNLAILQLGTKENFNAKEFARRIALFTCRDFIPYAFRDEKWFTNELKQCIIDAGDDLMVLSSAMHAAAMHAAANARTAATYARAAAVAYAASYNSACSDTAAYAAYAAIHTAADAHYVDNAVDILTYFAKGVENILIDMNVPGKDFI